MPVSIKGTGGGSVTLSAAAAATDTTLTIPNTTGTVALTAGPTFTGTVTATTITSPSATALTIQSAGATAMTVDTSQNVGIGTSSPTQKLDVNGSVNVANNMIVASGYGYNFAPTSAGLYITGNTTTNYMAFATSNSERMRIDASGNLLLGTTTLAGRFTCSWNSASQDGIVCRTTSATLTGAPVVFQNSSGGTSGFISQSTSAVAYNTSSDYRLKKNIKPMDNGLETIGALKPVTYDWKIDGVAGEGFIAHEIQAIIPHAVTGEKDAVNEDGSIKSQGVDYSKIVVHLVAAIQELTARLAALEAK